MWLFHLHSMVKIQPLSLVFSLRNSWLKYFVTYSFGNSRKKVSTIFYDTAIFFQFSADGLLVEACYRYSFGTLRKHQPFPDKKVYKNISFHHVMWIYQSCFLIMPCGFVKLFKRAIGQKRNWLWKRKRCPSSRIQCRFIWWRECHSKMITVFRFRRAQYDCISFS